jgi:site-specific recombinase XerD
LAEDEEISANPMAKIKRPIVPERPVPIVPEEGLKRLFVACAGNTFEARRDTALPMLLLDTGAHRTEMVELARRRRSRLGRCCWCSRNNTAATPARPAPRWRP